MRICSSTARETGHLMESGRLTRTVSPSTEVQEADHLIDDTYDDDRTVSGADCLTDRELVCGRNNKEHGLGRRQTSSATVDMKQKKPTHCDSVSILNCNSKTQQEKQRLHGNNVTEEGQAYSPSLGLVDLTDVGSCLPLKMNHLVCQPGQLTGSSVPKCDTRNQQCSDFRSGHLSCPVGLLCDQSVVTSSTPGSCPVSRADVRSVRSSAAVSLSRKPKPKPLCLPPTLHGVSTEGRGSPREDNPLNMPIPENHSAAPLPLRATRMSALDRASARSRNARQGTRCSSSAGCTKQGHSLPLTSASGSGEVCGLKNASSPSMTIVLGSELESETVITSRSALRRSSASSPVASNPSPTLKKSHSVPTTENQCNSSQAVSNSTDFQCWRRPSVCADCPPRTHSSSSMDSVDSGVWSPSPALSPAIVDALFSTSPVTVSHPVLSVPQLPASREIHEESGPRSPSPLSQTPHVGSTQINSDSSVFTQLQIPGTSSLADPGLISSRPVKASDRFPTSKKLEDTTCPSNPLPSAQLSSLQSPNSRSTSSIVPAAAAASSLQIVATSRTNDSAATNCDTLCLIDMDRLQRSLRALGDACFYYPGLDSDGAKALLHDTPLGTFLVRGSSDPRFLYAVSLRTERGPTSIRIHYSKGLFQMDCVDPNNSSFPRFETILELLDFHALLSRKPQGSHFRWQEGGNPRRMDLHVRLSTPLRHSPPSLTHQARVMVNRCLEDLHLPARSTDLLPVPAAIRHFLRDYPYRV